MVFLRISTYEHNISITPTSFSFLQLFYPPPKFIYSSVIFSHAHTCVYVYVLYRHKWMCNPLNPPVFTLVFTYPGLSTLDNLCESSSLRTMDSPHLSILWHPSSRSGSMWYVPCRNWPVNWYCRFSCLIQESMVLKVDEYIFLVYHAYRQPKPLALTDFFNPIFHNILWTIALNESIRVGHPTVSYSLHYDQLQISAIVSICHKKKLLWWGEREIFNYGYKDKYTEDRNYIGLGTWQ